MRVKSTSGTQLADTSDYPERMGSKTGSAYAALYQDLAWLHLRWSLYRQLFIEPTPPHNDIGDQLKLLADTAPAFFFTLQRVLFFDVLVGLASITDRKNSGKGKDNLTLDQLATLVADQDFADELRQLVRLAEEACEVIRDWRHRRIAHRDFALALHPTKCPLPPVSPAIVETALTACDTVLNATAVHFGGTPTLFECSPAAYGDSKVLLSYLRHGKEALGQSARLVLPTRVDLRRAHEGGR